MALSTSCINSYTYPKLAWARASADLCTEQQTQQLDNYAPPIYIYKYITHTVKQLDNYTPPVHIYKYYTARSPYCLNNKICS